MDPNYANPDALDTLSSAINQTLIETGRFFRSKGSMQSRAQLKRTMPACREQFNLALDDLSEQIFMAKAFLERDYEAVKAKKATSEHVEDVTMGEAEVKPEPDQQSGLEPSLPEPEAEQVKEEENRDQKEAVTREPEPIIREEEEGGDKGRAKLPRAEKTSQPVPNQQIDPTAPLQPQASGPVLPGVAERTEINFEEVLNDGAGGANDFDLNLDFGDDDLGNQHFLGSSGTVGGGEGEAGRGGQGEAMATDVPGLGNSNTAIGGDALDMELQRASVTDSGIAGHQGGSHGDEGMPGQSSFDDLFMENDSIGEGNLLEGDGLMNLSELDDSWFT